MKAAIFVGDFYISFQDSCEILKPISKKKIKYLSEWKARLHSVMHFRFLL